MGRKPPQIYQIEHTKNDGAGLEHVSIKSPASFKNIWSIFRESASEIPRGVKIVHPLQRTEVKDPQLIPGSQSSV